MLNKVIEMLKEAVTKPPLTESKELLCRHIITNYIMVINSINNISHSIDAEFYDDINNINNPFKRFKIEFLQPYGETPKAKLILTTAPDDAMKGVMDCGSYILIDCDKKTIEDDAVYVYEYLDVCKVRRFKKISDNKFQVVHDNKSLQLNQPVFNVKSIRVIGRVVSVTRAVKQD